MYWSKKILTSNSSGFKWIAFEKLFTPCQKDTPFFSESHSSTEETTTEKPHKTTQAKILAYFNSFFLITYV